MNVIVTLILFFLLIFIFSFRGNKSYKKIDYEIDDFYYNARYYRSYNNDNFKEFQVKKYETIEPYIVKIETDNETLVYPATKSLQLKNVLDEGRGYTYTIEFDDYKLGIGYLEKDIHYIDWFALYSYFLFAILHIIAWYVIGFEKQTKGTPVNYFFYLPLLIFGINIYYSDDRKEVFKTENNIHDSVISTAAKIASLGLTMTFFGSAVKNEMPKKKYNSFLFFLGTSFMLGVLAFFYIRTKPSSSMIKKQTVIKNGFITLSISYFVTSIAYSMYYLDR